MGIVNKDKNTNKTVNGFAKGLISNSATMIRELANSKSYKIDITTDGIVVGELEFTSPDPQFTLQKVNNYLSVGYDPTKPITEILNWYYALDSLNIGASKQLLKLDERKLKSHISDIAKQIFENDKIKNSGPPSFNKINELAFHSNYWCGIYVGDSLEEAIEKTNGKVQKSGEIGFEITGYDSDFDSVQFYSIDGIVEVLTATKYYDFEPFGDIARANMKFMLPKVQDKLFNGTKLTLIRQYADNSSLTGPDQFAEAIKSGELKYGYFASEYAFSPSFQLTYDTDRPDKLAAIAILSSEQGLFNLSRKTNPEIEGYRFLELDATVTDEEVIEAYVSKLRQYDISNLHEYIADIEVLDYFKSKMDNATSAYRAIKKARSK